MRRRIALALSAGPEHFQYPPHVCGRPCWCRAPRPGIELLCGRRLCPLFGLPRRGAPLANARRLCPIYGANGGKPAGAERQDTLRLDALCRPVLCPADAALGHTRRAPPREAYANLAACGLAGAQRRASPTKIAPLATQTEQNGIRVCFVISSTWPKAKAGRSRGGERQ